MNEELSRIGLQFQELEVAAGSALVNTLLGDLEQKSSHGFLVVGLRHADGTTELNPSSEIRLVAGDLVIVRSREGDLPQLVKKFASKAQTITYRGVSMESHPC